MRTNICTALKKTEGEERGEKNEGAWESSLKQDSSSISTPEVLPISLYLIFNPLSLALPFALPSNSKQNKSRKSRNLERQMAEEQHRCQEPRLCVNNCGFFGNPATQNLCSKCYGDLHQSQPLDQLLAQSSSASVSSPFSSPSVDVIKNQVGPVLVAKGDENEEVKAEPTVVTPQQKPNRCLACRRRVGLTGFKCRCGMVFCGTHRYPEQHGCEFDFKSLGKEQIAKANPVVKGEKLQKI